MTTVMAKLSLERHLPKDAPALVLGRQADKSGQGFKGKRPTGRKAAGFTDLHKSTGMKEAT
jgi:hypothetical protein